MKRQDCPHLPAEPLAGPRSDHCETCDLTASLRVCGTCGYVGCCESSRGHDNQHWRETGHPLIRSLPLSGRSFTWCYACNDYLF